MVTDKFAKTIKGLDKHIVKKVKTSTCYTLEDVKPQWRALKDEKINVRNASLKRK